MNPNAIAFAVFLSWATYALQGAGAGEQDQPRIIELGGLRKATVVVFSDGAEYRLLAEMIPVKVFDGALNAAINRRLLIGNALRGLVRVVSHEPGTVTVTGATPGEIIRNENTCQITIMIPKAGIDVQPSTAPSGQASQSPSTDKTAPDGTPLSGSVPLCVRADLLSRKQEYATLIDELAVVWEGEIDARQAMASGGAETSGPEFANRVSNSLRALSAEIQGDLMLLSIEKEALLEEVRSLERRLLKAIPNIPAPAGLSTKGD